MAVIKTCYDKDNFAIGVAVPDAAVDCAKGLFLGPPETLREIFSNKVEARKVQKALVTTGMLRAPDLVNRRRELLTLLHQAGIDKNRDKQLLRWITHVYQREFDEE